MIKQIKRENVQFRSISDLKGYSDATKTDIENNPSLTDTTQYESIGDLLKRMVRNGHSFTSNNIDGYDEELHPEDMEGHDLADIDEIIYTKVEKQTAELLKQKKEAEANKKASDDATGSNLKSKVAKEEEAKDGSLQNKEKS